MGSNDFFQETDKSKKYDFYWTYCFAFFLIILLLTLIIYFALFAYLYKYRRSLGKQNCKAYDYISLLLEWQDSLKFWGSFS